MSESILLLGGSRQQVIAIETAKRLGLRTVLCDYLSDNPGQNVADVYYSASTTDKEAVLAIAEKEKVSGILAYASDPASPTAAYVAERMGLPGNPESSVLTMSEKHLFRGHLKTHGFPCPAAVAVSANASSNEIENASRGLRFPVVVKPTDSSGSKGVSVVSMDSGLPEAVRHADRYGRNHIVIIEEFVKRTFPYLVGGDIFVVDGKVRFWGLMSCLRDSRMNLVPIGKFSPSGLSDAQYQNVQEVLRRLVASLDIRFGELNVEVLISENDIPYVLELGSRAGGNMIPVQLSDASGIDLVEANVLCAMGKEPNLPEFRFLSRPYATYVIHSFESGTLQGVSISEEIKPYVYRSVRYLENGAEIEYFDGANKAIGILFLRFDSQDQMHTCLAQMDKFVKVEVAD